MTGLDVIMVGDMASTDPSLFALWVAGRISFGLRKQ
jgi:hypothetical protein